MAPKFVQPFTDGLSKTVVLYQSDAAKTLFASTRRGYTESGLDGFTPDAPGVPSLPTRFRMRYLHLMSKDVVNNKRLHRRVPCTHTAIAQYFNAIQAQTGPIETVVVDSITWYVLGYTGEYLHKTRG